MTDFVIAKYKEDISWVKNIKNSRVFIYDKSGDNDVYINLPNIGREAHTYLKHIINNYENLSDFTCFLQGNPYDNYKGNLKIELKDLENWNMIGFYPLSYVFISDLDGNPHHPGLDIDRIVFQKYFINKPNHLEFSVGALFIVDKKSILLRKKGFYESLLEEFNRDDIDNSLTNGGAGTPGNRMPWIMERVWKYIFDPNFKTKFDN